MTALSRASNRWRMDTGEQPVVPEDDIKARVDELTETAKALQKWAESFASSQSKIITGQQHLNERVDTLVDLINATDSKANLAMLEVRNTAENLGKTADDLAEFADYIKPKMKLEAARILLEADALERAEKWRRRIHAAWPFVKPLMYLFAFVTGVMIMTKGGPNILPWVFK